MGANPNFNYKTHIFKGNISSSSDDLQFFKNRRIAKRNGNMLEKVFPLGTKEAFNALFEKGWQLVDLSSKSLTIGKVLL